MKNNDLKYYFRKSLKLFWIATGISWGLFVGLLIREETLSSALTESAIILIFLLILYFLGVIIYYKIATRNNNP